MKSLAITSILVAFVAHVGSFLNVWALPYQRNPYTIVNMKPAMRKIFSFTGDLRGARGERMKQNETVFADRGKTLAGSADPR